MEDPTGHHLLTQLGLTVDAPLSDDGDSFVTLACRDREGRALVLKYVKESASPDAYRRLANEAMLFRTAGATAPLRLLHHQASGRGYLLTEMRKGRLLRPATMTDPRVVQSVAQALANFHATPANAHPLQRREHTGVYYVKVMTKHLLHLWPSHLNAISAGRALALTTAALPSILAVSVVSHGDFLPTNVLYHDEDGGVTVTDLEGAFLTHPLFDVLAICTSDERDLSAWDWQRDFLARYLQESSVTPRLDPAAAAFRDAYRGILVFFLVYRLNETRVNLNGGRYFDGLPKATFLRHKLSSLTTRRAPETSSNELDTRKRNIERILARGGFDRHMELMGAPVVHP